MALIVGSRLGHYEVTALIGEGGEGTQQMPKYALNVDRIAEVEVFVTAPFPVGSSNWGTRLVFPVVGADGTVKGPRINAKIHPFGADWGLVRADDCFDTVSIWTCAPSSKQTMGPSFTPLVCADGVASVTTCHR